MMPPRPIPLVESRPSAARRRRWIRALVSFLVFASACAQAESEGPGVFAVGEPQGEPVAATIGAAGGELRSRDGSFVLEVPAGAVATDTVFELQEIARTLPHGAGRAFRLGPEGLQFAAPVRVSFALGTEAAGRLVAFQDEAGHFVAMRNTMVDAAAGTVSVETTHFSDWTTTYEAVLVPSATSVRVGESLEIEIRDCIHRERGSGGAIDVALVAGTCARFRDEEFVLFESASVNGAVGGNALVGTISGAGDRYTYTAPGTLPARNPVALSVAVVFPGSHQQYLVVSNVTVIDGAAYTGTSRMDQGAIQASAAVSWTESTDAGGVVQYLPSGTASYEQAGCTVTPSSVPIAADDGYLEIDFSYAPPRYHGVGTTSWTATIKCVDLPAYETTVASEWLQAVTPTNASPDGKSLTGSYGFWSWAFIAP